MLQTKDERLSKREQQIMDIMYEHGKCTANQVHQYLPDPPSYSAVRAMLRVLEEKGIIGHMQDGIRYVFYPIVGREKAKRSALQNIIQTFFNGSAENAVAALIDMNKSEMTSDEFDRMAALIKNAKAEEK
ncbi:MAG: BlaI/MecI/CopY family transcriptional regulator [Calditrichaeota bacterium]|nr:BlaI/MecI/CopY family transcriptional regulator [Calditrichota bacterium]